jgi:hypothetical protein
VRHRVSVSHHPSFHRWQTDAGRARLTNRVEGSSGEDPRLKLPRLTARALAPVVIVLLLGVVAIVSAGGRGASGVAGHGPPRSFFDYVFSTLMIAWVLMSVVFVYVFFRDRQTKQKEQKAWSFSGFRAIVMLILFFVIALQVRGPLARLRDAFSHGRSGKPGQPGTGTGGKVRHPRDLEFQWAPLIITVAVGLVLLGVFVAAVVRRRALLAASGAASVEEALADVMDDALADIRGEQDARKAIIAAYARMEKLLAGFGRARSPSEAPFEYLARVLVELRVSRRPVEALTELFERAKFSTHALDAEDKARAIEALEAVRDELRNPLDVAAEREAVPA